MKKAVAFLLSLALTVPCYADVIVSQGFVVETPEGFQRAKNLETPGESSKNYVYRSAQNEFIVLSFDDLSEELASLFEETESFWTVFNFGDKPLLSEETKTLPSGLTVGIRTYDDEELGFKYLNTALTDDGVSVDIYCMFPRTLDEPQCIDDYNAMIDTLARLDLLPPKQAFEYLDAMVTD